MIHNLTAEAVPGVAHLRRRLRARVVAEGVGDEGRPPDLARRAERQDLPGVRRAQGQRHRRQVHLPRRRSDRAARQHVHGAERRRAGEDVRPPAPRRPLRHVLGDARRPDQEDLHVEGEVLRARGRGVVGRVDDDHARRLGRGGEGGRHAEHLRRPTTRAGRRGTSRWDSASCGCTTARAATTRSRGTIDQQGVLTHGHLPENDNHGGKPTTTFADRARRGVGSAGHDASRSAASSTAPATSPPTARSRPSPRASTITFDNFDAGDQNVWHSITACKAPCTGSTGIAYPLADADVQFDSGQLGTGGHRPRRAATTWSTPADLAPGTYTYFCRIHPFMRGAFRVVPPPSSSSTPK